MEKIIIDLLEKEDKSILCEEKFFINEIELIDNLDQIKLELQQNNTVYKDIIMVKGLTFPIPKKDQILLVEKIYLKYDKEFELKLFIEGKIEKDIKRREPKELTKQFSFDYKNIFYTICKTVI